MDDTGRAGKLRTLRRGPENLSRTGHRSPRATPCRTPVVAAGQGNRTSKQSEDFGKVGVVPTCPPELAAEVAFAGILSHDVQSQMAQNREVLWVVAQSAPVLIFIHDDIKPPVQPVFNAPVRAGNFTELYWIERPEQPAERVMTGQAVPD